MLGEIRGEIRFKEPLAFHTSLRVGGPGGIFVLPQNVNDVRLTLSYAEQEKLPVVVLGGGTHVLVKDRGIRGIVIKLEGCLGRMEFRGDEVTIGAGAGLSMMIRQAASLGLGGVECLVGIPGTIGGALAMNAGTPEGAIGDFVSAVYFLYADGTIGEQLPEPSTGTGASRAFNVPPGSIMLGARLTLHRKPPKEISADITARLKRKKATEPLMLASAGYVWKNPGVEAAGRLLEKVGLKGTQIGGAEISAKHANFLVNRGGATAADLLALMELASERVHNRTGIQLEPKIRIFGD